MKKNLKTIALFVALFIIFFCASFVGAVKLIIEPRYAYMTSQGIFDEIEGLKSTILEKEQRIATLEEEVEMYRTALADAGLDTMENDE